MTTIVRQTYVISDLHLGGEYPERADGTDRGFRICTHAADVARFVDALTAKSVGQPSIELVINGDLVDFLAEQSPSGGWDPFTYDEGSARAKFDAIVTRDRIVFDALARFLKRGHRLVILLGNHDIELALPPVRTALAESLGVAPGADFAMVPFDEAYVVGDALIEHGNRYDSWNVVEHDRLQRLCALVTRRQPVKAAGFQPPAGSRLVAEIMNPVKKQYKFVDLLKPETEAVIPLLLALEPGYRKLIGRLAFVAAGPPRRKVAAMVMRGGEHAFGSDMADMAESYEALPDAETAALDALLDRTLGSDAAEVRALVGVAGPSNESGSDIGAFGLTLGMARLILSAGGPPDDRLGALLLCLRGLQNDQTFDEGIETNRTYLDAATTLAVGDIRHVVFGHTHMPKSITLPAGGAYLNSGTWADAMQFPRDIVTGPREHALPKLREFVHTLVAGDFSSFTLFRPTYVRIDVDDGRRATPKLCHYPDDTPV